jgi:putative SOS response-associated peptidase YedK
MCGRYAITKSPEEVLRWFGTPGTPPNFPRHYNAAPLRCGTIFSLGSLATGSSQQQVRPCPQCTLKAEVIS